VIVGAFVWSLICAVALSEASKYAIQMYASGSPNRLPLLTKAVIGLLILPFAETGLVLVVLGLCLAGWLTGHCGDAPGFGYRFMLILGVVVALLLLFLFLPAMLMKTSLLFGYPYHVLQ